MANRYWLPLLACVLAACSANRTTTSAGQGGTPGAMPSAMPTATSTGAPTTTPGGTLPSAKAVYTVPAGPDTPETQYAVDKPDTSVSDGVLQLSYDLPALLVGTNQSVSFEGALDAAGRAAMVSGEVGSAVCDLAPSPGVSLRCQEDLTGIVVDLAAVERMATASDPSNAAGLVAVAARFSSEPIGVLEIRE